MNEKIIKVKDYLSKSKLPGCDYVINPYIGCSHACMYCYACFMKRFTGHTEDWGSFIDVKICDKPIKTGKLLNKSVFISSVTDCYNVYEEKYLITRNILQQLVDIECQISISTKSKLILRDTDLFIRMKDLKVSMSINTLDETFKNDMDNASSIADRINTLKELKKRGIYTVLFMSPIFPYITDFKSIIDETHDFIDEYWFENLNLRGSFKTPILDYIRKNYLEYMPYYEKIYIKKDNSYWDDLSIEIGEYCRKKDIKHVNYFYHEQLVKKKKDRNE